MEPPMNSQPWWRGAVLLVRDYWTRTSLIDRLHLVACGIGILLAVFSGVENLTVNIWEEMASLAAGVAYLFFLSMYLWKKIAFRWELCVVTTGLLAIMWFFNDGFEGGAQYFFTFTFIAALVLLDKLTRVLVLAFDSLVVVTLLVIEYFDEAAVVPYVDRASRFFDVGISFSAAIFVLMVGLNAVIRIITLARQETERKNEELNATRDRLRTLGLLTAQVGHELNSPNHVIALNALLLETLYTNLKQERVRAREDGLDIADDDARLSSAFPIIKAIVKASGQIGQVLTNLRSEVRPQDSAVVLDLGLVVRQTAELYELRWREETSRMRIETPRHPILIRGVEFRLQQLLINLVTNSLHALSDREKGVTVTVEQRDGAVLVVADEGVGMSAEVQAQLGTSFFTTRSAQQGTGFGWGLCQEIAQEHHGEIELQSREGVGTTVTVRFPSV
jgi:signal transduction histidine kinase